jgi:hypothetical protein
MLRPIMMRPPFRPTDEMLRLRRFKSLVGQAVTVAPRGPRGVGWRPYYTRLIHANGYQQRQRELAFVAVRAFLLRRIKHGNDRAVELQRSRMHPERAAHGNK